MSTEFIWVVMHIYLDGATASVHKTKHGAIQEAVKVVAATRGDFAFEEAIGGNYEGMPDGELLEHWGDYTDWEEKIEVEKLELLD